MHSKGLVVQTKLKPPRLHKYILPRPRLTRRLMESLDSRLTIVQAGTGYGKSTALATLVDESEYPFVWYQVGEEAADPLVFLLYLLRGFHNVLPNLSEVAIATIEDWKGQGEPPWETIINMLVNELVTHLDGPFLLILDDAHQLNKSSASLQVLDRLIARAPAELSILLSTRYPLKLPTLVKWQVKGEVLEIGEKQLAFTPQEITCLFNDQYNLTLTSDEVQRLADETEGWVIMLQLVWQGLHSGAVSTLSQALDEFPASADTLFTYLTQEILEKHPAIVREFLLNTAVLREMTAPICDCFREAHDSDKILRTLLESGLFVVDMGAGHLRYHHIFHEFLCRQTQEKALQALHRRAATCYLDNGAPEESLYHLLEAKAFAAAAKLLDRLGPQLVRDGRLDMLGKWLNTLPPEILAAHPALLSYMGDIARLRSRFNEALGWYRQAETQSRAHNDVGGVGMALRGQARVYLDTVNPSQAEHLLQAALRLSDGQEDREDRVRLLELLAENRLNLGRLDETKHFQAQARKLREEGPGKAELSVRVLLRTGQLEQARRLLEERAESERCEPILRPRAHRETLLLLSLILVFQGEADEAYNTAIEGTERGKSLHSPFSTAVGYMRQGHAWLLREEPSAYEEACRCYHQAIEISNSLVVPRLKVEAYWGLCRAHGFQGDIAAAERTAEQGLTLAERAGDAWIAALIRASMASGYALAQKYAAAADLLEHARAAFHGCGDSYGQALSCLWQCLVWWETNETARLERGLTDLLSLVRKHDYVYLLDRQTLLGPPDPRRVLPLLLFARDAGIHRAYIASLLARWGLSDLEFHPGYRLRVQTLGPFRVWRGRQEVSADEWQREKARQLFLLLLTYHHRRLDRDQIMDLLWPDLSPETARRDFKVALSTLFRVLEPGRKHGEPSAYVLRDGSLYGPRPGADFQLDTEDFERLITEGDQLLDHDPLAGMERYRSALSLYQGEYLQEYPYADWCSAEREQLLALYLRTADRLANLLVEQEHWEEAITVCQAILARDNCWEQAYCLLMLAYDRSGNRAQVRRTYHHCVETLQKELAVTPSAETDRIYHSIA